MTPKTQGELANKRRRICIDGRPRYPRYRPVRCQRLRDTPSLSRIQNSGAFPDEVESEIALDIFCSIAFSAESRGPLSQKMLQEMSAVQERTTLSSVKLSVIICSTRPGRIGPEIAQWFHSMAAMDPGFDAQLVDLATFKLPVYDEPNHPRLKKYQHAHTKAWSASVEAADAFVFVVPEYNHAPPASLINALTYLYHEWAYKPASFVSYGGVSAGLRGVQVCKPILNALRAVPIGEFVPIPVVRAHIGDDGSFTANDTHAVSAKNTLAELLRWHAALKSMRHKDQ